MRRLLPFLLCGIAAAQPAVIPTGATGPNYQRAVNSWMAWLNTYKVGTSDSRLTDARTPFSHVHIISDITALQTALDAKQPTLAVSSTIVNLFTGCSGILYLGADGACHAAGGGGACKLASDLGFSLAGGDETTLLNATLSAFSAAGGGCLAIDAGKILRADGQIVLPHGGSPDYLQPTYRITSNGGGGGLGGAQTPMPAGGTLDLRFHGSGDGATWKAAYGGGPKILSVGVGQLELDHVTIWDGGSDCAAYLMATSSQIYVHEVTFLGSKSYTTGCNDAIILGSPSAIGTPWSGSINDIFSGYASVIRDTKIVNMARFIFAQTQVNGVAIENNYVIGGNTSTPGNIIEFSGYGTGSNANRGNVIRENLLELAGAGGGGVGKQYTCAISLHNTENTSIAGNGFWDPVSGSYGLCGDSTATKNVVDKSNFLDSTGGALTNSTWSVNNYMPWRTIPFFFDGGGSALSGTISRCALVEFGGVVNQFSMQADQTGSATIKVTSVAIGSYTGPASATTNISPSGGVALSSASLVDTTLTGWTRGIVPQSMVCVTLSSPSTVTWVSGRVQVWEGR